MSDFQHLSRMARAKNLSATFCSNELRALQLRGCASFRGRFLNTYWNDPWSFFEFIDTTYEEQREMLDRLFAPGCNLCKGKFLVRLAERLQAPPQLSAAEQIQIVDEICLSCPEDPLIVSMYGVELLHAEARQSCQSCMTRRKQMPIGVFSTQHLKRSQTLHANMVGNLIPSTSVKAALKEKQSLTGVESRRFTGHAMYVRQRNSERSALPKPQRQEYYIHLQAVHQEWRDMLDADKTVFEDEARLAEEHRVPRMHLPKVDPHETFNRAPFGVGSRQYPCSAPHLSSAINDMLPEAKKFLRNAYEACRAAEKDLSRVAGVVVPDTELADVDALGRLCRAHRPCIDKNTRHMSDGRSFCCYT